MKTLYHGSNTLITDGYLTPHISFDYKPLVYATDDYTYALVRCGKFNLQDISIKEEYKGIGTTFTLIELRENAFKDIFNTVGYIYDVPKICFVKKDNEYISEDEILILHTTIIQNVWEEMQKYKDKYEFISFADSDVYFKQCGIDKVAYFERRKERIKKLKEIKNI